MDKTKAMIATHNDVFLIAFRSKHEQYFFGGGQPELLGELIKEHGQHGIEFIKRFDKAKAKFNKMNKSTIKTLFGWDTYSILMLEDKRFI